MDKKRVLVTGGAGFLGSYICEQLSQKDWAGDVIVPRSKDYDLRKQDDVERLFRDAKPDIVIHAAAHVGGIGDARKHPGQFFYDTAIMGIQVLHQSHLTGVEKFVGIGTICSYPKFTECPFKEEDLWKGYPEETNASYGIAKKAMLVQGQAYHQEYGMNAIHLLPVNLYGPRDNFDLKTSHVIPAMIRKFTEAKKQKIPTVTLWGDGSPTRELLYVGDAARGVILATEGYDDPEPVNLGTGRDISIRDLAVLIADEVGFEGEITWDTSKPNGQPKRCLDVSRAKERFGFEAEISFEEGIKATIAWFNKTLNGQNS